MALNLPSWKDPKARKVYLMVGAAAAGFVGYRWWQARNTSAGRPVDSTLGTGSVVEGGGGGLAPGGNVQYGGADIGGEGPPATNADWANLAVQLLVNQGWDGATVQVALGKYLNRQALTDAEVNIVQAAIAVAGSPPVGTFTILDGGTDPDPGPDPGPDPDPWPDPDPDPWPDPEPELKWYFTCVFEGPDPWEHASSGTRVRYVRSGGPYDSKLVSGVALEAKIAAELPARAVVWSLMQTTSISEANSVGQGWIDWNR